MNIQFDPGYIGLCFVVGFVLGAAYFFGLWVTARTTPRVRRPGLLLLLSFVARLAMLLGGLYGLTRGEPIGLLAALIGLYLGRQATTRTITGKGEA